MGLIVGISVRNLLGENQIVVIFLRNLLGVLHHIAGRAAPRGSPRLNEKRSHFPPASIFILILSLPLSIFPYTSIA